eukprot:6533727-Ditylum_brightwellii.AAC.1
MERSKQNKHVVYNKDDNVYDGVSDIVDNGDDDGVDDGDDDSVEDSVDGAEGHLTYLSQVVDCCLTVRSKQNKHVVCNKDDNIDDVVDNDEVYGVEDGDDDCNNKHLAHLSQAMDCCLT